MTLEDDWKNARPMDEAPPELREAWDKLQRGEGKLDFSRFHPMDHRWWQCWSRNRHDPIYGKTWTHLRYWWMYMRPANWKDEGPDEWEIG